ncbi:MAG: polysaccharide biosynthesis tyrosine autokinase [Flavobacteriaceae bacterium]|jgi:capsular exopolysaccharide synthesis family protein|nr:polysaccharide biosynthesis tyrosine autokinase [Flavobacteriaceae bacterium]
MELLESLPQKHKNLDLKKEILKYLKNWYWILGCMILCYATAKIYLRYTNVQYLSKATLKFPVSRTGGNAAMLSDLKTLGAGIYDGWELQGETAVITAKPLLEKVVENLDLNVGFYGIGNIKSPEIYDKSPLTAKILKVDSATFSQISYEISPSESHSYKLSDGELKNGKNVFKFGVPVQLPFGTVIINKKPDSKFSKPLKIVFRDMKTSISSLENSITVTLPEGKGSMMELSMTGAIPKKSEDILNELVNQYNAGSVKDRNRESQNSQDFIDERLAIISKDLSGIENQKEGFKKENKITDLDSEASLALDNSNSNMKQLVDLSIQLDLVNSIFAASSGDKLLPTNMGLSPATESYISEYNKFLLSKSILLKQATVENPSVVNLNKQIDEAKSLVRQNLIESKEALQLKIAQIQGSLNADRDRINKYPTQEKIFRGIERQQTLKEQLYLYLLQKREENAIALAVTTPKAQVVNPAYTSEIVKPKRQQIILVALLAGLLLPILFFYTKFSLDTKVHSKGSITSRIPNSSVIAEIPLSKNKNAWVEANDFSVFAESFRILTSNLKFILKTKKESGTSGGVILITSSVKGEGKTTISMNTALTLAGTSKVLIIGADMRNPQLQRFLDRQNTGLTDYLISDETSPEAYIFPSEIHKNLDVMFSGTSAPNPNDLLDMQKFDDMITDLKSKYRYLIIDSAPVMLVSDTLHLTEISDVVLYVAKANFTEKNMLDFAEEFRKSNEIKNMFFVLNNVEPENSRYGRKHGYYGYH